VPADAANEALIDSNAVRYRVRTHTASFGITYKFGPGL
jgi:hypothetical protein